MPNLLTQFKQKFQNTADQFWRSKFAQKLGTAQRFVEKPPQFKFAPDKPKTVGGFAKTVAQDFLNIPSRSLQAGARIPTSRTPQQLLGNIAGAAELPITLATFGAGGQLAGQAGKVGLGQLARQGAITGAKYGGGFGALRGVSEAREAPTFRQQFTEAGKQGLMGAATGAAFGAAVPVIARGVQVAGKQLLKPLFQSGFAKIPGQQPRILYRAVDSTNKQSVLGKGTYGAFNKENVARYGKDIRPFAIDHRAKLLDLSDPSQESLFTTKAIDNNMKKFMNYSRKFSEGEAIGRIKTEHAIGLGYQGIVGDDKAFGTVIFDSKLLRPLKVESGALTSERLLKTLRPTPGFESGKQGQGLLKEGFIRLGPESKKPVAAPPGSFEEAAQHVGSRVGPPAKGSKLVKSQEVLQELKQKLVDSFSPIEDTINAIEKKGKFVLLPTADPRLLRNRVLGSQGIASEMIKKNLEPTLKQIGPKNVELFDQYLAARQAIDVSKRGIKTGIDSAKAQRFLNELSPQFEQQAQQVTKHTQDVLRYMKDGQVISNDLYNTLIKRYPNYVPLNRVFEAIEQEGLRGFGKKAVGSLSSQNVIKSLKGSERQIESPLGSILQKTTEAAREVEVNGVARSIANLSKLPGFEDVIRSTPKSSNTTISAFINGKKQFFEVPREFAVAAKNLDQQSLDILTKTLAVPTRTARFGFTGGNLPFIITNFPRDQITTILTSKNVKQTSILNPFNWTRALFDTIKHKDSYDDFISAGGGWSTFYQVGRNQAQGTLKQLASPSNQKITNVIKHPSQWLAATEDLVSVAEEATRVQQFRGTRLALGGQPNVRVDPFAAPTRELLLAAKAGRENSVDFAKGGAYKNVLNSAFIYLNAGIQGTRTMARAIKTDPKGTALKLITTLYTPVALATLWNTATEQRRQAYADINDWERNTNLIILPPNPTKDEKGNYINALKIPLPQGFRGLVIPVRSAIEHLVKANPESIAQTLWDTIGEISPVDVSTPGSTISRLTPTALTPILEAFTNKKLFTGSPIVPRSKENLPPGMQSRYDTSAFIKKIGETLKYSPAKLQNFVSSYSGGVGLQVLNAIDKGMAAAGIIKPEEIGGRGIIEDIKRRLGRVSAGKLDEQLYQKTKQYREKSAVRTDQEKTAAESIYGELKQLPSDQWQPKLSQLKKDRVLNENIFNRVKDMQEADEVGLNAGERSVKFLPIKERALYIRDRLGEMDASEHRQYLADLKKKKILTEKTYDELIDLGYSLSE